MFDIKRRSKGTDGESYIPQSSSIPQKSILDLQFKLQIKHTSSLENRSPGTAPFIKQTISPDGNLLKRQPSAKPPPKLFTRVLNQASSAYESRPQTTIFSTKQEPPLLSVITMQTDPTEKPSPAQTKYYMISEKEKQRQERMREVQQKIEKLKRELGQEEVRQIEQEHQRCVSKRSHRSGDSRCMGNRKIVTQRVFSNQGMLSVSRAGTQVVQYTNLDIKRPIIMPTATSTQSIANYTNYSRDSLGSY